MYNAQYVASWWILFETTVGSPYDNLSKFYDFLTPTPLLSKHLASFAAAVGRVLLDIGGFLFLLRMKTSRIQRNEYKEAKKKKKNQTFSAIWFLDLRISLYFNNWQCVHYLDCRFPRSRLLPILFLLITATEARPTIPERKGEGNNSIYHM